jgi:hypothetical protein
MPNLAQLVSQKIKADGLNLTAAAKSAGVSIPSFRGVLSGKSVPNARSIGKYAAFLGLSGEEIAKIAGKGKARKAATGKGKAKKAATGKGRGRPAKAAKVVKVPGRRGRPPAPGPSPRILKRLSAQIARAEKALGKAKAILG